MKKQQKIAQPSAALLKDRVLARVLAVETLKIEGGNACCSTPTSKGAVSDIDPDQQNP